MKKNLLLPFISSVLTICLLISCNKQEQQKQKTIKPPKNVKIIATLGKEGWKNIQAFCESGANIFRINGSHIKSEEQLKTTLEEVNKAIKSDKCKNVEVMYDTQGPEIRTIILEKKEDKFDIKKEDKSSKKVKNSKKDKNKKKQKQDKKQPENNVIFNTPASYEIQAGDTIIAHTNLQDKEVMYSGDEARKNKPKTIHIGVNYTGFVKDVKKDMILTIENRLIYAKVNEIDNEKGLVKMIITEINTQDGKYLLTDRRHINLIGEPVSLQTLTDNDKKYIKMSALAGVQYYAISFVRDENDIKEVKELINNTFKENGDNDETIKNKMANIKIIAKIETKQGMDNLKKIVQEAEGAMVARGDLASEIPMEAVPYAKQEIIKTCNKFGKFSILATDVLKSMMTAESPSRNDVDVVISSLQIGADSLMLSNETAQSEKGIKSIKEMKKLIDFHKNWIIKKIEKQQKQNKK